MTAIRTTVTTTAVSLTLVLLSGGCTRGQEPGPLAARPAAREAPAAPRVVSSTVPLEFVATAPALPVIARGDGEIPGVRVEVNELRRSGRDFVMLRMTLVNDGSSVAYADLWQSSLVDLAGRRKYGPLNNGNPVNCLCSSSHVAVAPSERAQVWVRYGAPPAGVASLELEMPKFLPITDVPLSE